MLVREYKVLIMQDECFVDLMCNNVSIVNSILYLTFAKRIDFKWSWHTRKLVSKGQIC